MFMRKIAIASIKILISVFFLLGALAVEASKEKAVSLELVEKMRSAMQAALEKKGLSSSDAARVAETASKNMAECTSKLDSPPQDDAAPDMVIVRLSGSTFIIPRNTCVFEILENAGVLDQ
jgi:hypothetical protein